MQPVGMIVDDLAEDFVESDGDLPIGIVGLEFREVGDVADVVALAVLVHVLPVQLLAGHLFDFGDGFKHGNTVFAAAAHVVNLSAARIGREFFDGANHIVAMNIIAYLLGLVAKHIVSASRNCHFHQI